MNEHALTLLKPAFAAHQAFSDALSAEGCDDGLAVADARTLAEMQRCWRALDALAPSALRDDVQATTDLIDQIAASADATGCDTPWTVIDNRELEHLDSLTTPLRDRFINHL